MNTVQVRVPYLLKNKRIGLKSRATTKDEIPKAGVNPLPTLKNKNKRN